jgi:D-arabinose 1-dehydrogenase-like Zn-dependent alcohol dehydrogenase
MPEACSNALAYGHERMRRGWELSGAFATHVHVLSGTPVVVVPEDVPASVLAPASCATATAVAVLESASAVVSLADSVVLIAGAGMLGLTACAMAAESGARVVMIEPHAGRRQTALAFGAHAVADSDGGSASARKLIASVGRGGGRAPVSTVGLEVSGSPAAARLLLGALDSGGVLVLAGSTFPAPELQVSAERIVHDSLTIRGVHEYAPEQLERGVDFLRHAWTRYPFAEQVGHVFELAFVDDALEAAIESAATGGVPRVAVSAK